MRNVVLVGLLCGLMSAGCAKGAHGPKPITPDGAKPVAAATPDGAPIASDDGKPGAEPADAPKRGGAWIGAAAESEMLLSGTRDTVLGVWVDVPEARPEARPPMDLVLAIDTSGSMAGEKLTNARSAAATLVRSLKDGDIVSLVSFDDHARVLVHPTKIDVESRDQVLRVISRLHVGGSTNMFEGLSTAESHMSAAPETHSLRRVVMISDGIANVGPSTPQALGMLAERGLRFHAQVTSLGVGIDYDERTLNALSVRSSGRMYHIGEARELASIMKNELDLLNATVASDAFVEIMPAPGVQLVGADGIRADFHDGGLRIPLGALHAGQHREALVRVRIQDPSALEGKTRSLASVRLRFRDPSEGDLERIQEVVARTTMTDDVNLVAQHESARTKAILAIQDAAKVQLQVAQNINEGNFVDADRELAASQRRLEDQAMKIKDARARDRVQASAKKVAAARRSAATVSAAPKPAQRSEALKQNAAAMDAMGF